MKKHIRVLIIALLTFSFTKIYAQTNFVVNPDFEIGGVPTERGEISFATGWNDECTHPFLFTSGGSGADLLDRLSPNSLIQVPANSWGSIDERTGDRRYAHLYQTQNISASFPDVINAGERLKGNLIESLIEGDYNVCFWGALAYDNLTDEFGSHVSPFDAPHQIIEVYLVKDSDCEDNGKLILTTPTITYNGDGNSYWENFCADFTISASEANNFNKILFKIKNAPETPSWHHNQSIYIDEISIQGCKEAEIDLPEIIEICDDNFEELCGPLSILWSPIYTYEWWGPDSELPMSVLLSTSRCFIPDNYGSYILKVTDENGCVTSHHITITQPVLELPEIENIYWCLDDLEYPVYAGWHSDPFVDYEFDYELEWTYNETVLEGLSGHQIPFMGEGIYCVTISTCGTTIEQCFEAKECCEPNIEFSVVWYTGDIPQTIKIDNEDTSHYDDGDIEQYFLYQDCTNDGIVGPWTLINTFSRSSDFNTSIIFEGLNPDCFYKIVHAVSKNCLMKSFVHTEYVGGNYGIKERKISNENSLSYTEDLKLTLNPNPTNNITTLNIKDFRDNENYHIEVYNMQGLRVIELKIQKQESRLDLRHLENGLYLVKITNKSKVYTTKIIKQ